MLPPSQNQLRPVNAFGRKSLNGIPRRSLQADVNAIAVAVLTPEQYSVGYQTDAAKAQTEMPAQDRFRNTAHTAASEPTINKTASPNQNPSNASAGKTLGLNQLTDSGTSTSNAHQAAVPAAWTIK